MNGIEQTHTKHQKYQWGLWRYFFICVYIYTHAYTHTNCIYICMHIDIYIDTYIYIYIYINICIPGSTRPRWGRSLNHIKCAFGKGCWQQCLILLMTKGMTDCMNGRIGPWKNGWVTNGSLLFATSVKKLFPSLSQIFPKATFLGATSLPRNSFSPTLLWALSLWESEKWEDGLPELQGAAVPQEADNLRSLLLVAVMAHGTVRSHRMTVRAPASTSGQCQDMSRWPRVHIRVLQFGYANLGGQDLHSRSCPKSSGSRTASIPRLGSIPLCSLHLEIQQTWWLDSTKRDTLRGARLAVQRWWQASRSGKQLWFSRQKLATNY